MRILVCATDAPLPPLNGMRLHLRELCGQLARRHEVCVLAFRWPDQHGDAPEGVELRALSPPDWSPAARARARAAALARFEPVDSRRLADPMRAAIAELRAERDFDVAHVTLGELAGVAPALDGLPALVAPLDAWALNARAAALGSRGPMGLWRHRERAAVERFVAHAYRPFRRVVLVSDEDAEATRRADPTLRTAVVPGGVDTEHFRPDAAVERTSGTMLFTGTLAAPANVRAAESLARHVLPRVREHVPGARLVLAGRAPGPAVSALAGPHVEVLGDLADLRPQLRAAAVFACAMRSGTGVKNKLLEAMACGTPAVATPLATRGLAVRDGEQLLIADGVEDFAGAVGALLGDAERRALIGAAGREHVVAHHSWAATAACYEALYEEIAAEG